MLEFIKNNISITVSLFVAVVSLFITPFLKTLKAKKIAKITISVLKCIPDYIQTAEMIRTLNGIQKKSYVLSQVKMLLSAFGVPDLDITQFDEEIEKLVLMSKNVNINNQKNGGTVYK